MELHFVCLIFWLSLPFTTATSESGQIEDEPAMSMPTVMIATLIRNKEHLLPTFLYYLQNLDYPKDNIVLWLRSDHNHDRSSSIVESWLDHVTPLYQLVDFYADDTPTAYADEVDPASWSHDRFAHVIQLRQSALDKARQLSASYLLYVDADNLLTNPGTLKALIAEKKTVIAPVLNTTATTHYSNFWCGMDEKGYYLRTPDYMPIVNGYMRGCFGVALVHSTILIHLRDPASSGLSYSPPPPNYTGPFDDIIVFAHSAQEHGVVMYVMNRQFYGWLLVPVVYSEGRNSTEDELEQFVHLRIENIIYDTPLQRLEYIPEQLRPINNLELQQIYMINLERRSDRRKKMLACLEILGFHAKIINAVDGRQLNASYLDELGVRLLPEYRDPYGDRPITMGEVGCFLSHYFIWQEVLEKNYSKVLVLEDDVRFEIYFRQKLSFLLYELHSTALDWDLVYLGRKRLTRSTEHWVEGTQTLVWPEYTYWTLSYLLNQSGAQKLLRQNPLAKLLPVDEYLPIMFDRHPQATWKAHFYPRDLIGLSAEPLLAYPTYYTGEVGYITDTEDSLDINTPSRQRSIDEL